MAYYRNPHVTQYDGSVYEDENCTPSSAANGVNAVTKGRKHPSGADVRKLVKRSEETDPGTPGWSLADLDLAMTRLKVKFSVRSGEGWAKVAELHRAGYYLVLQGDSDQFANGTCSGRFNGNHAIGVHPEEKAGLWRIDDPICRVVRYEKPSVLRAYAMKFSPTIRFGAFSDKVPQA